MVQTAFAGVEELIFYMFLFQAVFALVVLIEYKLKVLDNPTEEQRIWDLILHGRELVNRKKEKKRVIRFYELI